MTMLSKHLGKLIKGLVISSVLCAWLATYFYTLELQRLVQEYNQEEILTAITEIQPSNSIETYQEVNTQIIQMMDPTSSYEWHISIGEATAYAPHDNQSGICAQGDPNVTSIGLEPGLNIIAVDPEKIPYGSYIIVMMQDGSMRAGYAGDTGGGLRNSDKLRVDLYMETYDEAINFGRQEVTILWTEIEDDK